MDRQRPWDTLKPVCRLPAMRGARHRGSTEGIPQFGRNTIHCNWRLFLGWRAASTLGDDCPEVSIQSAW